MATKEMQKKMSRNLIKDFHEIYMEDIVLAFTEEWRDSLKVSGEYLPFKEYLQNYVEFGEGMSAILAAVVLRAEWGS